MRATDTASRTLATLCTCLAFPCLICATWASLIRPDVEVLFLETGFHFAETLAFKEQFAERLGIAVTDLVGTYTVEQQEAEFYRVIYGVSGESALPRSFALAQNSPNPFNPSTTISFDIPAGESRRMALKVFDVRGKLVRNLVEGIRVPGRHSVFWDGMDETGRKVASGVYFYRMESGDFSRSRKMVLLK